MRREIANPHAAVSAWPPVSRGTGFLSGGIALQKRSMFFVDGFNLYHALDSETRYHKYKWLNLRALAVNLNNRCSANQRKSKDSH